MRFIHVLRLAGFLIAGLFSVGSAAWLNADSMTFTAPDRDTTILGTLPNSNFGAANLSVGAIGSADQRSLLSFNVSALGSVPSLQVESVVLKLFAEAPGSTGNVTLTPSVYAVTSANGGWVEGGGGSFGGGPGATWNDAFLSFTVGVSNIPWAGSAGLNTPGTDYVNTLLSSVTLQSGAGGVGASYSDGQEIDFHFAGSSAALTALIQSWVTDNLASQPNPGLLLLDPNSASYGASFERFSFSSKENGNSALDPELVVTYAPEPATLVLGLIGFGALLRIRRTR